MKRFLWVFLILAAGPAYLSAGPIYGVILFNSRALGGASVSIVCPGAPAINGSTLDDGSYNLRVSKPGRCTFRLTSRAFQGAAQADVVSLNDAVQYNFVVVAANGGYELRRSK